MKVIKVLLFILFFISHISCIPEEVLLHGDINGIVTDAETSEPLGAVSIGIDPSANNSSDILSGSDGSYQFENIRPGSYEITASKESYIAISRDIEVKPGDPNTNDIALSLQPWPEISPKYLDFGHLSTSGFFTIRNVGSGNLGYTCYSALDWIKFEEPSGNITTETDTIYVTIDRSAISEETQKEFIRIISFSGDDEIRDTVHIFANGVADEDGSYYRIVTIGTQTWMAENLNTGTLKIFSGSHTQSDNSEIEKYCYGNKEANCDTYGGLYRWDEVLGYVTIEDGVPDGNGGIDFYVQGICPDGWHIPTADEWDVLIEFAGGYPLAGERLKADDPLWLGDTLKTDEFGFRGLPGGDMVTIIPGLIERDLGFYEKGSVAFIWSAYAEPDMVHVYGRIFIGNLSEVRYGYAYRNDAASVRCIKDP